MKKYILFIILIIFLIFIVNLNNKSKVYEIHIGYQSVTSQTWGALIIKNKNIFKKKLKKEYPNKKFKVVWHDEISGAVINTSMISNKVQIGFMGDMPLILNMNKAENLKEYDSKLISIDGIGVDGLNQSIIIPKNSKMESIKDLQGKTISTPIGSSSYYMVMKLLDKYNMNDKVNIIHQDVAMASQLLSSNKIDAFSIWEPYPTVLNGRGLSRLLIDGSETKVDYIAGVIVNNNWYKDNEKIVLLFKESLEEAHELLNSNKKEAAKIIEEESEFDYEYIVKIIKNIKWNNSLDENIINNLKDKQEFLLNLKEIDKFDLNKYIERR